MGHSQDGPRPTHGSSVLTPPVGLPAVDLETAIPAQRTAEPAPPQPVSPPGTRTCTCGHPEDMHEHYRSGSDCGACGTAACPSFRDAAEPQGLLRRLLRKRS